jgi:LysR family transcriptional regulator, transcriptional activator of nhaA
MEWLNYHHLLYFWVVAKEGTIAQACERLDLSQPTISAQLKKLERSLGERLFRRSGRKLELTETGLRVFRYADEIFSLGRELLDTVKGRASGRPQRLVVGVPDSLPKLIVYRLLKPVLHLPEPVHLVCKEGKLSTLLADLAIHRLDVVLADRPLGQTSNIKAFSHLLGECGISIFGAPDLANEYRRTFPQCLNVAPVLLPTADTELRRTLDSWFDTLRLRPRVVIESEDSALLKEFGRAGLGLFPGPSAIDPEIQRQYGVEIVARLEELKLRYFAISVERRLKHPAVLALSESARQDLLAHRSPRPPAP